jgi:hypothetical protein
VHAQVVYLAMVGSTWQHTTAEQVLETVRQTNSWVQDVTFDWELKGKPLVTVTERVNAPLRTGRYRYRPADGAMWIQFYEYQEDGAQKKYTMTYLRGLKRKLIENIGTGLKQAEIERLPKRSRFEQGDLPWYIYHVPYFTDLSSENTPVEFLGWEEQSGRRCAHLVVYEFGTRDAGKHLWIDLARGGHPLRFELRANGGVVLGVTRDVVLEEVLSSTGETVWFPVKGTAESTFDGVPQYRAHITITKETIQFNQGLADHDFDITVPNDAAVTDLDEKSLVSTSPAEVPTQSGQVPTVVADTIRRAEQQKSQIEARSRARVAWSWETLLTWGLAGTAVVLLLAVMCLRRARV